MSCKPSNQQARFLILSALLGLSACGGGGGDGGGGATCSPAPQISSTPLTVASVGQQYVYDVQSSYACIPLFTNCGGFDGLQLPQGAGIDEIRDLIYWTPTQGQANTTAQFRIATKPDLCGNRATQAWTVMVHPAPVITSFAAASSSIRRGDSATLTAVFQGNGGIDGLGAVTSGVPITTAPLNVSTTFTLRVRNNSGIELRQSISIQVPSPPAIHSLTTSPTPIAAGGNSTLSWTTSGDFTVARLDPLGIDVRGLRSVLVSPATTTLYTLHLADDVGASVMASVQVEVVPMPTIESFVATPSSTVLGGTVSLVARFQGKGRIDPLSDPLNSSLGPVNPGQSITSPPLRRSSGFRLVVDDIFGRTVSQDLFVDITGPGTFRPTSGLPLVPVRRRHSATLLADGRVFLAGGVNTDSTELYDPITETFTAGPRLLQGRQVHSAVLLRDGRVLLLGGTNLPFPATSKDEIYDPNLAVMTPTSWDAVGGGAVARLRDDRVFVGGWSGGFIIDATARSRSVFISLSGATHAGCLDSGARLNDGRVLIVLGAQASSSLFLPASDSFTLTGAAGRNRGCGFKATLAGDGRVLVTGGDIFPGVPAEIYNPTTGLFSDAGSQQAFTTLGTGSMLTNGKVLLIGGSSLPQAEIFDPLIQSFTGTGGLRTGRQEHTATLLRDGRVLVVGGCQGLPCEAELYTPP